MEKQIEVSVIVPIYNTEKHLDKCIQSLLSQTLKEIEIILVNDGSKDSSLKICQKYQEEYPNKIVIFDKENGGMSSARNAGLEIAKGKYIGFVDSDDYVEAKMYESMLMKAKENDYDLVVCDLDYVYEERVVHAYSNIKEDLLDKEKVKESIIYIYPSVWNKLYKREILDESKIRFTNGVWYEDVEFTHRLYPYIKSIGTVHEYYYKYIQRKGSIMTVFNEKLYDYLKNWRNIVSFYKKYGFYDEYKKELEYCCIRYLYATFLKSAARYPNKEDYKKAVLSARDMVQEYFPYYRKNKYFYRTGLKGLYLLFWNPMIAQFIYSILRKK